MFEELSERQLTQLTKVWQATLKAVHWRESARHEMSRALATGCTLSHLTAVTGLDYGTIDALLREPRHEFNGRHPTDSAAPGQERFHR